MEILHIDFRVNFVLFFMVHFYSKLTSLIVGKGKTSEHFGKVVQRKGYHPDDVMMLSREWFYGGRYKLENIVYLYFPRNVVQQH